MKAQINVTKREPKIVLLVRVVILSNLQYLAGYGVVNYSGLDIASIVDISTAARKQHS